MAVIYRSGDLLKAFEEHKVDRIAHGVNCSGGFGSGIAGQIALKYPTVKWDYLIQMKKGINLGEIYGSIVGDNRIIYNCATQLKYGRHPLDEKLGMYCSYDAIKSVALELEMISRLCHVSIGIPKIGAGLAGGDWNVIEAIFKEVFTDINIYVYVLD